VVSDSGLHHPTYPRLILCGTSRSSSDQEALTSAKSRPEEQPFCLSESRIPPHGIGVRNLQSASMSAS